MSRPYLSIVIPLYNEAESVPALHRELAAVLDTLDCSSEVIVVDDGSSDGSFAALQAVHERDPRWVILRFRRNHGQTTALSAGFAKAAGEIVITSDADLQNDPRDIPRLLAKMDEGHDIVSGWRKDRKEPFLTRRLPSMLANSLISRVTGVHLHDYGCTLKAYRSVVVKNIQLYGELHRFIPAVASQIGVQVTEIPVNDRPRVYGSSKYGISRTIRVLLDLITVRFILGYSTRPLQVFGGIGLLASGAGVLLGLILSAEKLIWNVDIGSRPLLILSALLIISGVQLISIGLVAEIIVRSWHGWEAGRPTSCATHWSATTARRRRTEDAGDCNAATRRATAPGGARQCARIDRRTAAGRDDAPGYRPPRLFADQHCSFKDLLAHLTVYEALALQALQAWQRGERHPVSDIMRSPARSLELHYGGISARSDHSLAQVLDEWEQIQAGLVDGIAALSEEEWRSAPHWPTREALDLGGMLEEIIVTPPRPLYRHLPVHVPDSAAYIRSLR